MSATIETFEVRLKVIDSHFAALSSQIGNLRASARTMGLADIPPIGRDALKDDFGPRLTLAVAMATAEGIAAVEAAQAAIDRADAQAMTTDAYRMMLVEIPATEMAFRAATRPTIEKAARDALRIGATGRAAALAALLEGRGETSAVIGDAKEAFMTSQQRDAREAHAAIDGAMTRWTATKHTVSRELDDMLSFDGKPIRNRPSIAWVMGRSASY
jgi:hypothetical protein